MFISSSANWHYVRERSSIYGRLIVQTMKKKKGELIDILRILLHGVLGFQLDIFLPFRCKINWPSKDPLYYCVTSRNYFAFILDKILSLQGYNWTKVVNYVENCTVYNMRIWPELQVTLIFQVWNVACKAVSNFWGKSYLTSYFKGCISWSDLNMGETSHFILAQSHGSHSDWSKSSHLIVAARP